MTRDLALAGVFKLKARNKAGEGVWTNISVGGATTISSSIPGPLALYLVQCGREAQGP